MSTPKSRLRGTFSVLREVLETATEALFSVELTKEEAPAILFDLTLLQRAKNALDAIRVLCEVGHWEFATSAARQIFELLVNVEYIETRPSPVAAKMRYQKFGLLQMLRYTKASLEYNAQSGRAYDADALAELTGFLENGFVEFRVYSKKGNKAKWWWATHWDGQTTKGLADASKVSIRADQYRLLFSAWSEQTHGSPSTTLAQMVGVDATAEELVLADDVRIAETVAAAITMFLELWGRLEYVRGPEPTDTRLWFTRLNRIAAKYAAPMRP